VGEADTAAGVEEWLSLGSLAEESWRLDSMRQPATLLWLNVVRRRVEERKGEIGNGARLSEWQAWLGMDQATWMERKNGMNYIRAVK